MYVTQVIPVSSPRLRVVRETSYLLRVGVKSHYAVARTERGRSQWWGQGKIWNSGPGSVQLKQPGDVHRDVAHSEPITFQVILMPASDLERVRDESKLVVYPHLEPHDERARAFHRLHDASRPVPIVYRSRLP